MAAKIAKYVPRNAAHKKSPRTAGAFFLNADGNLFCFLLFQELLVLVVEFINATS